MAIELRQEFSNDSNMFSIHQILATQQVPGNLQIGRVFSFCHARKTIFLVNFKNVKSLQLWLIPMNYHKPSQDTRKVPLQTNCWLVVLTILKNITLCYGATRLTGDPVTPPFARGLAGLSSGENCKVSRG